MLYPLVSLFKNLLVIRNLNFENSIGYNKSEAGYLVAVSAVLDLIGRLGLGWLSDLQLFDRRKTYILWYVNDY